MSYKFKTNFIHFQHFSINFSLFSKLFSETTPKDQALIYPMPEPILQPEKATQNGRKKWINNDDKILAKTQNNY